MNREILAEAHPHVRAEWERSQERLKILERALALAVSAYSNGIDIDELPGDPPDLDAPRTDWIDYFVSQGALVLQTPLPGMETLS